MINFQYHNPARIVFGPGSVNELAALLKEYNVTALQLVYSGDFIKDLGIYAAVENACKEIGAAFFEDGRVHPNPSIELVREIASQGRANGVDFVLAVGGGSAIDTAKAVALGIPYDGDVWDFFAQGAQPEQVLPIGAITTLPASGSETSNAAILSSGEWKLGFEDNRIIPRFAIMDPEYTMGLPRFQTAAGVADILSHLLERYFSPVDHTDVTDYLIEGAVRALLVNGERIMDDPGNLDTRAEIQWLASIAHNNLLDTGRIGDWGAHRIEHELSGQYEITHGEGMAVVTLAWLRYAAAVRPEKPAQLAERVFGIDSRSFSDSQKTLKLAEHLEHFFRKLKLSTTLAQLGIGPEHFEEMAARATKNGTSPVGHYIELNKAAFVDVLKLAKYQDA